jgi:hypothetical protein
VHVVLTECEDPSLLHKGMRTVEEEDTNLNATTTTNTDTTPNKSFIGTDDDCSTGGRARDFGLGGSVIMGATEIFFCGVAGPLSDFLDLNAMSR